MTALDALLSALDKVLGDYYRIVNPFDPHDSDAVYVDHALMDKLSRAYGEFRAQHIALEQGSQRP